MSTDNILDKVKELRELTGVGFKDCKNALEENNVDIDKSIEFLRKKGIAKANKKMERVAAEGLVCICEKANKFTIIDRQILILSNICSGSRITTGKGIVFTFCLD